MHTHIYTAKEQVGFRSHRSIYCTYKDPIRSRQIQLIRHYTTRSSLNARLLPPLLYHYPKDTYQPTNLASWGKQQEIQIDKTPPPNLPPPKIDSHIHSPTPSPTLYPIWVPPACKSAFHRQSGRRRARRTRQRALGWKAGSLELAPPCHLPYTSPASLPYTTHLPTQAAYPIPPTYPATPPQRPTLYHAPASQVTYPIPQRAYPTPRPPPTPSRLPYPSQPAYPTPAAHACPVAPQRPTLYPPFVACRRPASRSLGRSVVRLSPRPPTLSPAPNQPTLSHTRSHQQRHTQPAYPIPHQRQPHTPSRSPEATPRAAYPTP
jgi:hypothetical protein